MIIVCAYMRAQGMIIDRGGHRSDRRRTNCYPHLSKISSDKTYPTKSLSELSIGFKQSPLRVQNKNLRLISSSAMSGHPERSLSTPFAAACKPLCRPALPAYPLCHCMWIPSTAASRTLLPPPMNPLYCPARRVAPLSWTLRLASYVACRPSAALQAA